MKTLHALTLATAVVSSTALADITGKDCGFISPVDCAAWQKLDGLSRDNSLVEDLFNAYEKGGDKEAANTALYEQIKGLDQQEQAAAFILLNNISVSSKYDSLLDQMINGGNISDPEAAAALKVAHANLEAAKEEARNTPRIPGVPGNPVTPDPVEDMPTIPAPIENFPVVTPHFNGALANDVYQDVAANTEAINQLQNDVQLLEDEALRGVAMAMSAAAMPQATDGRNMLSIGLGEYAGYSALSLGYSANFGDTSAHTVKLNLSHSDGETGTGLGYGYSF